MRTVGTMIVIGALTATFTFADNSAEERFKAKYGRFTPGAKVARLAENPMQCGMSCCRHMQNKVAADLPAATDAEARFQLKLGRYTPAEENRQEMAKALAAEPAALVAGAPATISDAEERFKAKFGRYTPLSEQRFELARKRTVERELLAAQNMRCEHCARHRV